MNIYFAGSIMGGREKQRDYFELIEFCKNFGNVLTEHIGKEETKILDEKVRYSDKEDIHVYLRDTKWIDICDIIIADVSVPSLGVGYEIGYGESLGKKVICLYCNNSEKTLSYMLSGNLKNVIIRYNSIEDVKEQLNKYFGSDYKIK